MVITDDQGKNDLTREGNPYIKTPNIDKFHSETLRFTNFHVSTTSAPTRGALMTGRHTNRLNVFHTISGRSLFIEEPRQRRFERVVPASVKADFVEAFLNVGQHQQSISLEGHEMK